MFGLPSRIGNYTIVRLIADGGCATVYLAQDAERRKVAIKVSKLETKRKNKVQNERAAPNDRNVYADLMQQESTVLKDLRHPSIVQLLPIRINSGPNYISRATELPGEPWYIVMEYIPGKSLASLLRQVAGYPMEWRLELFYQILIVVEFMHTRNKAHCDLKPENIMFRADQKPNALPLPVLLDFGVCSEYRTLTSEPAASEPYCAPEMLSLIYAQEARQQVDIRQIVPWKIDVYALGILFVELITGKKYLANISPKEMRTKVLSDTKPGPRQINSGLPEKYDRYFYAMAAADPETRMTVTDLIEGLNEYLSPPPRIALSGSF